MTLKRRRMNCLRVLRAHLPIVSQRLTTKRRCLTQRRRDRRTIATSRPSMQRYIFDDQCVNCGPYTSFLKDHGGEPMAKKMKR